MPEDPFARDRAKQLAHELVKCRQRGLDGLDSDDHHRPPRDVSLLAQLAQDYHRAKGLLLSSRPRVIRRLIWDGMQACATEGHADLSRFVGIVFFAKVGPDDTAGKRKEGVQTIRRAKAMAAFGLTEDNYDTAQLQMFTDFASFLLAFVAATVAAQAGPSDSTVGNEPVATMTVANPAVQPAGEATSAATDEPLVTTAADASEPSVAMPSWWQVVLAHVRQNQRAAGVAGGVALLLVVGLTAALMRQPTHQPVSAGAHSVATRSATGARGSTGAVIGAQLGPAHTEMAGQFGAPTFTDPHNPSVTGARIEPYAQVQVSCKVYAPTIPSVSPDGYWYRIVSPPWNGQYYAAANTFMNGDKVGGPSLHNTDFAVPNCSN